MRTEEQLDTQGVFPCEARKMGVTIVVRPSEKFKFDGCEGMLEGWLNMPICTHVGHQVVKLMYPEARIPYFNLQLPMEHDFRVALWDEEARRLEVELVNHGFGFPERVKS